MMLYEVLTPVKFKKKLYKKGDNIPGDELSEALKNQLIADGAIKVKTEERPVMAQSQPAPAEANVQAPQAQMPAPAPAPQPQNAPQQQQDVAQPTGAQPTPEQIQAALGGEQNAPQTPAQ